MLCRALAESDVSMCISVGSRNSMLLEPDAVRPDKVPRRLSHCRCCTEYGVQPKRRTSAKGVEEGKTLKEVRGGKKPFFLSFFCKLHLQPHGEDLRRSREILMGTSLTTELIIDAKSRA